MRLVSAALGALPDGPVGVVLPPNSGEGIACAELIRGDVWHWLRLDHGQIAAVFPRDRPGPVAAGRTRPGECRGRRCRPDPHLFRFARVGMDL